MSKHVLQRGGPGAPVVVVYFVGQHMFAELVEAVGAGVSLVVFDERAKGVTLAQTLADFPGSPVYLAGYSAGCQDVRRDLRLGAEVSGVICIDGTHAAYMADRTHPDIAVWRSLAESARARLVLFVATCTQQTYVETDLPAGKRYMSTRAVLQSVTGADLRFPLHSVGPVRVSEGDLHVHSYASSACDEAAHIHQQRVVLPEMLRRYLRPWLERQTSAHEAPCGLDEEVRAQASAAVAGSLRSIADELDHGPKGDA